MQLTAQEEYGLRCLLQVARHEEAATAASRRCGAAVVPHGAGSKTSAPLPGTRDCRACSCIPSSTVFATPEEPAFASVPASVPAAAPTPAPAPAPAPACEPEPLRIPDIAAAEGLSPEYAAKLMRVLRQGGLVVSTRGAAGGYRLTRAAETITVWEVLSVLGGPLFSDSFCSSHPGQLRDCVHTTDCSVRALWRWVGEAVREALRSVTLADMYRGEHPMAHWLDTEEPIVTFASALRRAAERPIQPCSHHSTNSTNSAKSANSAERPGSSKESR